MASDTTSNHDIIHIVPKVSYFIQLRWTQKVVLRTGGMAQVLTSARSWVQTPVLPQKSGLLMKNTDIENACRELE
jgi:hypothetical protein